MVKLDPKDMIDEAPEALPAAPVAAPPPAAGLTDADIVRIAAIVATTMAAQQPGPAPARTNQAALQNAFQSGEQAQMASPTEGRVPVTVLLQPRHKAYLDGRAAAHGETPERHLESILRQFQAHHDAWQPTNTAPSEPGQMAGTARA